MQYPFKYCSAIVYAFTNHYKTKNLYSAMLSLDQKEIYSLTFVAPLMLRC